MRQWTATHLAKLARKASIVLGKRYRFTWTSCPQSGSKYIKKISAQVDDIVFISGTNGKTTTSNLIGHTLKANHIDIIHNNEGANMAQASHLPLSCKALKILK